MTLEGRSGPSYEHVHRGIGAAITGVPYSPCPRPYRQACPIREGPIGPAKPDTSGGTLGIHFQVGVPLAGDCYALHRSSAWLHSATPLAEPFAKPLTGRTRIWGAHGITALPAFAFLSHRNNTLFSLQEENCQLSDCSYCAITYAKTHTPRS